MRWRWCGRCVGISGENLQGVLLGGGFVRQVRATWECRLKSEGRFGSIPVGESGESLGFERQGLYHVAGAVERVFSAMATGCQPQMTVHSLRPVPVLSGVKSLQAPCSSSTTNAPPLQNQTCSKDRDRECSRNVSPCFVCIFPSQVAYAEKAVVLLGCWAVCSKDSNRDCTVMCHLALCASFPGGVR